MVASMERSGFCPNCLNPNGSAGESCGQCGTVMLPLFDDAGAISAQYLSARGTCCGNGCRNCPYPDDLDRIGPGVKQKVCEACGKSFACGGEGCWCSTLVVAPHVLSQLRDKYGDCLCKECLARFAS